MDWKLKYDYDGYLVLHCTSIGDYCAREISLEEERNAIRVKKEAINEKIALVQELKLGAEERKAEPEIVSAFSQELERLVEAHKKLNKEWWIIHREVGKEKDKNQLCRDYYANERNYNRLSTFQYKK